MALETWSRWRRTTRAYLDMPEDLILFCAMALGRADPDDPVNTVRSERAPLDEVAVLRGF